MQPQPQVTHDIRISVKTAYNTKFSRPELEKYIFAYYVTIENVGNEKMQLLRRHWLIQDSLGPIREVEGEGVIGEQPILEPGGKFEYNSWTDMKSTIGRMYGFYTFHKLGTDQLVQVEIPEFQLVTPFQSN